ncbi:uncharacterized protein LOC113359445 [Papaver somniferum]|uniref:uncharacterized protein LOC113359445 n=1 Tax=Papaver somniferum TaxID=3469 RepID=UPI000E6F743B|nr:uncharacterized protein LOC113359445 [Papaver somniferum]
MSTESRETSKKKKTIKNGDLNQLVSWRQKKAHADKEEETMGKEIEELITWTSIIEAMDDQQLKEYVTNRPENMQSVKITKSASSKRGQRSSAKSKCTPSNALMDAIWKFHREEDDETSLRSPT